ncbi:restriction endonuclease subunit S [Thauera sinica]|uniref:Restriction endonuclease subunit S n=1 Tax=Thauera sinica TaxID=2665146 RepID=A0ABW1AUV3_9RHOO|nr:restriction endonuclease subunit S [Thauera sp. K11]ATE62886.1 hypothetical protein CCZ27_22710 [Thauera sp. K11]
MTINQRDHVVGLLDHEEWNLQEQAVAVTTDREEGMVASHRFPMYVAKDFLAEPEFILRLFLTHKGKKLLELASPGGAGRNKTLGQKEFESLKIALPSPPEQRKVATFLLAVDERIAQLRARYEWLTKYKKGVIRKLFAQDVRFKDAAGCEFPDWQESSFGEVAELRNWKYDPDTSAEALRCVELEHVSQETGRLLGYVDSKLQRSVKNRFAAGDVLFGKLRPYLRKYLKAPFDGACSTEIWVLNGKKVTNDFLFYLVQSESFMTTAQISSGSKMPRADWGVVSSGEVAYPCPEEQTKIAGFLFALDAQIACAESQLESAKRYKQGILRNMFIQ